MGGGFVVMVFVAIFLVVYIGIKASGSPRGLDPQFDDAYETAKRCGFRGSHKQWFASLTNECKSTVSRERGFKHELYDEHADYWWLLRDHLPSYTDIHGFKHRLGIPYHNPYVPFSTEWALVNEGIDGEQFYLQLQHAKNLWYRTAIGKYALSEIRSKVEKQMRTHRLRPARARRVSV